MNPVVTSRVRGDSVYFTINWSALAKGDKYAVTRTVPSVGGVYELYVLDDHKKLNLVYFAHAWYGGLRAVLRKLVDPELQPDPKLRTMIEEHEVYYRYSCTDSNMDMLDIVFFFESIRFPGTRRHEDSGRYATIYVNENSPDKIVTI